MQPSAQSPGASGGRPLRESASSIPVVKAQINFLVSTLSDDNFERNCHEIRSLCEQHGLEAELHVIRTLIRVSALDPAAPLPFRLLAQETRRISRLPSKAHRFRDAIERGEGDVFRVFDFPKFVAAVGLSPLEKVILAASVALSVTRSDLAMQGKGVLASDFSEALNQMIQSPAFDGGDLPVEEARQLLSTLLCESPLDVPLLSLGETAALLSTFLARYGGDSGKAVLQSILPTMHLKPHTNLSAVILSFGNDLLTDTDIVYALLSRFGITENSPTSEQLVVDTFRDLTNAAADGAPQGDLSTFVTALGALSTSLDWSSVVRSFDQPVRQAVDTPTLKLLVSVLLSSPPHVMHPAVDGLWTTWSNPLYQLRLLDALLSLPSDTFSFVVLPGHRIITTEDVPSASATIKSLAANVQNHTWNSLDLVRLIVNFLEIDNRAEVTAAARELLEKAIKISPELVEMGLLKLPMPWSPTQTEYIEKLLEHFLSGHPNHQLVLFRIYQTDEDFFMASLRGFYQASELNITRILDIAQDLKILDKMLGKQPHMFALDLAALASRREYLNLEKWLSDSYSAHGDAFSHATMEFLDHKIKNEMPREVGHELRTLSLNAQTIAIFLTFLRRSGTNWSRDDIDYFREIRNSCLQLHPRLMNLSPGSDQEPGMAVVSFAPDIEAQSETIFKRMYEEETSVDYVLHLLQQYKAASSQHDHEVFACMLHTLFDEYKFFPVYPPRELSITAVLFGSLIEQHLVEFIPLGIAIRYVLDALRQPLDSNMFQFGVQALARFQSRLGEWHELCHALLAIPHFQEQHADLADVARRALFRAEGPNYDETAPSDADGGVDSQGPVNTPFHALSPDVLQDEEVGVPTEQEADQMLFIVNNLAINNCEAKSSEMRELFKDEHARWFAHYLVDQRISSEPNNHELYIQFVDFLNRSVLHRHLLNEAFIKARGLLNSETAPQSAGERSVLKNLGSWIGLMTLAKDKPIKHRNLAFKSLLLEGYDSNRLVLAIPFVCKILEQCAKSTIFHPPNPWLMGLVRMLAEFYHYGDLVLNLKFEIEVLCIALDIDLDKIEATEVVRTRAMVLETVVHEGFTDTMDAGRMDGYGSFTQLDGQIHRSLAALDATPGSSAGVALQTENIIATLDGAISINPQLGPYAENDGFKRFVQMAIESAIREIIIPVVDRSVTIASISTQQLVAKDFAMEPDEERMRDAAHLMVKNLAGNLALVTCKEPLRINMVSHLRNILNEQGIADMFSEQAVLLLVQDNLNAACNVIQKAAMDRAVAEVDKALEPAYLARFRHREQRPGQPFWYSVDGMPPADYILSNRWPELLRLSPAGLSVNQTRVYEDFANIGNTRQPTQAYRGDVAGDAFVARRVLEDVDGAESDLEGSLSIEASLDRFNALMQQLSNVVSESEAGTMRESTRSNDITLITRHLIALARQVEDKDKIGLAIAQRIVQLLYKCTTDPSREAYVYALQQLLQSLPEVRREVVQWLVLSDDERKLNVPVTLALLEARLVDVNDLDSSIGHAIIRDFRPSFVDFAASLIRETLVNDPVTGFHHQFPVCYEALLRAASAGKSTDLAIAVIKDIQGPEDSEPYSTLASYFRDWVRSYQQTSTLEATFIQFVTHPEMQGILRGEDISSLFFRVCMEVSAEKCSRAFVAGASTNPYLYVDALSKLIAMIIKYHGEANNEHAKVHYLTKSLSIIVLVLAHAHEESDGLRFESRPFFRLFSSLLNEFQSIYSMAQNTHFQLLLAFSDTFNTLQPSYFPGFAFAWIGLVSHRAFMAKMLHADNREGWAPFHRLLISLLKFLGVFLRNGKLETGARHLYLGSLRILVVLLHDFPEFLSEHYFTICEVIPPNCLQLRNVVLSAFPSHMKLPDPLGPRSLAIEHVGPIPPILFEFATVLKNSELRTSLDQFLLNRGSASFPTAAKNWLLLPDELIGPSGDKYNLLVLNALVMYIGVSSVAQAKARSGTLGFVPTDPGVQVFQRLSLDLDVEGQHHLLSAIATHLRYPNAHTHWFSSLMLHLFSEIKSDLFQEILVKVLLEKFLVEKPHPWGAIATLAELIRQPRYGFWSREFLKTRGARDLHDMLEAITNNV